MHIHSIVDFPNLFKGLYDLNNPISYNLFCTNYKLNSFTLAVNLTYSSTLFRLYIRKKSRLSSIRNTHRNRTAIQIFHKKRSNLYVLFIYESFQCTIKTIERVSNVDDDEDSRLSVGR